MSETPGLRHYTSSDGMTASPAIPDTPISAMTAKWAITFWSLIVEVGVGDIKLDKGVIIIKRRAVNHSKCAPCRENYPRLPRGCGKFVEQLNKKF